MRTCTRHLRLAVVAIAAAKVALATDVFLLLGNPFPGGGAAAFEDAVKEAGVAAKVVACGGDRMIEDWQPDGAAYSNAVRLVRDMLGADGELRGIAWCMEPSDAKPVAGESPDTVAYDLKMQSHPDDISNITISPRFGMMGRMERVITSLRRDLGSGDTPFVTVELAPFLDVVGRGDGAPYGRYPYRSIINNMLRRLRWCLRFYDIVLANDLSAAPGGERFSETAAREVGRRCAARLLALWRQFERDPAPQELSRLPPGTLRARVMAATKGSGKLVYIERPFYQDGHYYRNFGGDAVFTNLWFYAGDGSYLKTYDLSTGESRTIVADDHGSMRDVRVSYDARRLLFSWRPAGTKNYRICECDVDGKNLRFIAASDKWDDFGAEYLPDGGIIFVSSRGRRFIPCNHAQGAQLFRMEADGSGILCLSANNVRDDHPSVMANGQICYDRWEYVDANIEAYREPWFMNPDGTGQYLAFAANPRAQAAQRGFSQLHTLGSPMQIPGCDTKFFGTWQIESGSRDNSGHLAIIDVKGGPDAFENLRVISPPRPQLRWRSSWLGGDIGFHSPCALSEDCFLAVENNRVYALDDAGNMELLFKGGMMTHDPRPLAPRPRERVLAPRTDLSKTTGVFYVSDVYEGRPAEMAGLKRGTVKKLLIMEDLPKPISAYSLPSLVSCDGSHTLRRVIGEVPVEDDGSCAFEVPALRAFYFVALDAAGLAVKRMQSYTMVMPGEVQGCIGCHDRRISANPTIDPRQRIKALTRAPSRPTRPAGTPEISDYLRDIQPILDRHCVKCHNPDLPDGPAGRVQLTGDRTEWFCQSYYSLCAFGQLSYMLGRYEREFREHKPYGFGSGASPLMGKIDAHHHGVKLDTRERDTIRLWIEGSCTYPGTYAIWNRKSSAVAGCKVNSAAVEIGPEVASGRFTYRCLTCHDSAAGFGRRVRRTKLNEPKHCWNLYNLSHPEKSTILRAPLRRDEGGWGWCRDAYGATMAVGFSTKEDPLYQQILGAIQAASRRQMADRNLRPELPGFVPNDNYVRWMKFWGVVPPDARPEDVNPYEADRRYWESLWYRPR